MNKGSSVASNVQVGDQVMVVSENGLPTPSPVLSVKRTAGQFDMFAPMTSAGTIVVDSVVVSIYGNVDSHGAAHAVFFAVRVFPHCMILVSVLVCDFPKLTRRTNVCGAGVGIGMLRGEPIPCIENNKKSFQVFDRC